MEKTRTKKLFIFFNPAAGHEKKVDLFENRIREWGKNNGWRIDIHRTHKNEDLKKALRQRQKDGIDVIGVAGGDGTVSEVISAMAGIDLPLLIIPAGTGNIFARNFYIPFNLEKSLSLLNEGSEVGFVDLMLVNGSYRMLNAGAGFNARLMISTTRDEKQKLGFLAYLKNIGKSLKRTHQVEFVLTIDGKEERIVGADVFIPNAGFGMHSWIEENLLNPNDGVISVFVTRPSDVQSFFRILWDAIKGKSRGVEVISRFEFKDELLVESDRPLPAQSDGEPIGTTPLRIKVVPSSLKLIIPVRESPLAGFESINKYFSRILNLPILEEQTSLKIPKRIFSDQNRK